MNTYQRESQHIARHSHTMQYTTEDRISYILDLERHGPLTTKIQALASSPRTVSFESEATSLIKQYLSGAVELLEKPMFKEFSTDDELCKLLDDRNKSRDLQHESVFGAPRTNEQVARNDMNSMSSMDMKAMRW